MKLIPISVWAKKHRLSYQTAIDMARKGKLVGVAERKERTTYRWMIRDSVKPPKK